MPSKLAAQSGQQRGSWGTPRVPRHPWTSKNPLSTFWRCITGPRKKLLQTPSSWSTWSLFYPGCMWVCLRIAVSKKWWDLPSQTCWHFFYIYTSWSFDRIYNDVVTVRFPRFSPLQKNDPRHFFWGGIRIKFQKKICFCPRDRCISLQDVLQGSIFSTQKSGKQTNKQTWCADVCLCVCFDDWKQEQTSNIASQLSNVQNPYDIPLYWLIYGDPYHDILWSP